MAINNTEFNSNIEAGDLVRWRLDWFLVLSRMTFGDARLLRLGSQKLEIINLAQSDSPAELIKGVGLEKE